MLNRSSGILLPVFSLPSKYGIGTFGKKAYEFVDFLRLAGQKYWQILPLGHTSYGDSPYSPFSVFGGNPYFIDLEILIEEGLLEESFLENIDFGNERIDYKKLFENRYLVLRKAWENARNSFDIDNFVIENPWVENYGLFMALKYKNKQLPWYKWDEKLIDKEKNEIYYAKKDLEDEIRFWIFLQHLFFKQYFKLKEYANNNGISIIGDIPIYAALDSADVWWDRDVFLMDEDNLPKFVAGVPPDDFSEEGQLWGNPVFDWEYLKKTEYEWWINRINFSFKLYDVVRLDHFRGFDEFWAVPYGSENAIKGKWMKAYGKELFNKLREKSGKLNIIVEDLGIITDSVTKLKNEFSFPGMKVLQFAFDGNPNNPYLPENYEENSVAYTGTHDNDTLRGWYEKLDNYTREYILKSLNIKEKNIDDIIFNIIKILFNNKAKWCIIPLQDFLSLGEKARINTPSTVGSNWQWRLNGSVLSEKLAVEIRALTKKSRRMTLG